MLIPLFFLAFAGTLMVPIQTETPDRVIYDLNKAEALFEDFINKYEKEYENQYEKSFRFEIFKEKLRQVNERNAKANGGAVFGKGFVYCCPFQETNQFI